MRMFLYYALHSFWNQLKKMFKSWVLAFIIICFLIGAIIGIVAVTISNAVEKQQQTEITEQVEEVAQSVEEEEEKEPSAMQLMIKEIGGANFAELIIGALLIVTFVLAALGAEKNAGKIFLPADVNLLFPSPLKPQSVMMFRIANQLGQMVLIGVYMLFQMPNLVINLKLSVWSALALILAYCILSFFNTLLQLVLYMIGVAVPAFRKALKPGLAVLAAVIAGGFFSYQRISGQPMLLAAVKFFNAPGTEFIPFWGWLKGFCRAAIDGKAGMALLLLGLFVAGSTLLIFIIWSLKVDFYEDAMAKSEEMAELLEAARTQNSGFMVKRKKDRSEKLRRDGMKHGCGANVFFFKNLYNRNRFAHFGFLTKTMEFYLIAAIGAGYVCKHSIQTSNVMILVAIFAVLVFFRSMGNPLEADTKMSYFVMVPESTWAKLFYSLLSGLTFTAMDLFLPMIVGAIVMGANPLIAVLWIIGILSVDAYSTTVGVFISVSLPVNAGQPIKQFIQILFVYFGLLPDIIIVAVGYALGFPMLGIIGALVINLVLAFLFFALAAMFLEPRGGTRVRAVRA